MKSFDESSGFLSFFINSLHFNQQSCPEIFMLVKGPYIKDVRTEGGGGLKNCSILRTNKTDRLREMRTRGRGGVKNHGIFADVLYVWSLIK